MLENQADRPEQRIGDLERRPAGKQMKQRRAHGINVAARIDALAEPLFRSHVQRRADRDRPPG